MLWNNETIYLLQDSPEKKTYYIKIHAPHDTLLRYAEELSYRMPIEAVEVSYMFSGGVRSWDPSRGGCCRGIYNIFPHAQSTEAFSNYVRTYV